MDEDAVVLTQNDDKVVDTVEDRLEGLNFSNNDPGEDQEEGELSEKEDMNEEIKAAEPDIEEDVGVNVEVASKRIKHNLDDLSGRATMGLRGKDDYSQRSGTENLGKDNEDNLWLRDKMTFRSAATSYAPNLYNFAWAQAVQGNQGFKLVEKQDGDEEADALPDNGASFDGDDEMEDGLPESLADMTLKIPEGYDMRQVLYDRRLMTNASWNSRLGDTRREKTWIDSEDGMDSRRRFDRDERGGSRSGGGGRREMRSPSRRRDSRSERERGGVKSRLSEFERQRARDRERERENGRERGERNDNILRPTSSDESDYSRRNAPSGAIGRQSQSNDNIVDVREEGEIEEGEIELPTDNLRSRSSSREKSQDPRAESLIEDGISNGNLRKSLSSRLSFRNSSSSHPRSLSRESSFRRLQDGDLRHRLTKDVEREKPRQDVLLREDRREQIAHLTAVMKSVTVKDAQKAFINTCLRLDNAVKILQAFAMQRIPSSGLPADDIPRDLSKMATKVFQGLRAVYAVWNTANGREQERDRDTFPRLLQFVTESCLTYFSPKQARELEVFMDHVTKTARKIRMEGSLWHAQAVMKSAEAMQEPGVREREFVNASVSNSKMAPSGASTLEGNSEHNADSKDAIAEATIAAAALAYAQSSAAALANFTHGSTYNQSMKDHPIIGMDHWAWNGSNGPFERSMSPGLPPGYSGVSHAGRSLVAHGAVAHINSSTNSHGVAARPPNTSANGWISANKKLAYDAKSPYGPGFLEEDWEELSPPSQAPAYEFTTRKVVKLDERGFSISSSETINTFAPPSKMGNLPVSVNFRLASPTPSDGDDDHENQNTASAGVNGQLGHKPLHSLPKPSSSMPPVTSPFYKTSNTHVDDTGRVHYASAPMVSPASVDQELSLNFEQPKNQPVSGPVLSSLRSRDPRKQLQNGYLEAEGSLHQSTAQIKYQWPSALQTMDKKREGETYANMTEPSKRLKLLGSSNGMQNANLFASTSAIGGWLDEGAVVSAGHENHGAQSMDIDFDSPTPSERKHCLKDEFPGMNSNISEVSSASGSFEMLVSGTAASTRDKPPSDPFTSNSTNPEDQTGEEDVGRHRMRPRDPRRILLENAVETAQVNPMNVPVNDAAGSEMTLQYTNRSPEVADVSPNLNNQPSTNTLGNPPNQRDPRLNPYESSQSDSAVVSIQLSTEHKTTEWKTLDERIKESERDSNRNQGSEVSSGESTGDKGDHLHPWDPLLRKPRFGPSHWGGNDMHRDFEQLLEDLDEKQRIAIQNERKRRLQEQDRMFIAGKLCLVLDLDHTLLNSAKFSEIEPEWEARLRQAENMERSRALKDPSMKQELYRFPHMSMWTKLRPGIWKFLAKASELYELHVYTMGNKAYATEMAKLLDPTGTLFAGRVISKGDEVDGSDKSKDLDGVLGMESAVVIIDDSSRVWPHHRENLIVVERYMYFPSSRRQFGLLGPSLLEVGHDERAADGMLSSASGVIDRIHKNFFSNKRLREVDVRAILAAEQRRVLDGCRVLFSRIFPVGEANPHLHPLWRLAEQFGASCCLHINDKVTHVVAISLGTDKVNWAAATGRPVVRPAWLEASAILYRRANEQDFPVLP
ncbi:uncharacterized protein [Physcomitrium patens]|uniref:protein-serine/threonine phosphatase n=1 Tax=Physcomitrium patens TaxID=3218 RepID=A0A2K1IJW4_PHYPA|nr:uncharacterized protein LOC112275925 isoform X2 [Physcomitrium patens]PNR29569.1 hypothetical protein PHYPA_028263 [Physcomitrium patens]|eukprot:XP_024362469.1 uncharacterized protein LOC112275925 isoform X2 [Physcomitrella patens]